MSLKDPTYQQLANYGHFGVASTVVLTAGMFGYRYKIVTSVLFVIYGIVKEFWFDPRYERPDVSGGYRGGVLDFAGYCAGVAFANVALWIRAMVIR